MTYLHFTTHLSPILDIIAVQSYFTVCTHQCIHCVCYAAVKFVGNLLDLRQNWTTECFSRRQICASLRLLLKFCK